MTSSIILEPKKHDEGLKQTFLEVTGYSRNDILAWNPVTRQFLTRNGGKYEISEAGRILHLAGPSPDPEDRL